jgi:hypothetical protein
VNTPPLMNISNASASILAASSDSPGRDIPYRPHAVNVHIIVFLSITHPPSVYLHTRVSSYATGPCGSVAASNCSSVNSPSSIVSSSSDSNSTGSGLDMFAVNW